MQLLCAALKVRSDLFPFELYYIKVYDRYKAVRAVIRKCMKEYPADDWYKQALRNLERILASVINDDVIKNRLKTILHSGLICHTISTLASLLFSCLAFILCT